MDLHYKRKKELDISKVRMTCDKRGSIKEPLPPYHSFMLIVGAPSTGKTTLWIN